MKLIRVSDGHYIVAVLLPHTEISIGDCVWNQYNRDISKVIFPKWVESYKEMYKITHSTKPLFHDVGGGHYPDGVTSIDINEIEILLGYGVSYEQANELLSKDPDWEAKNWLDGHTLAFMLGFREAIKRGADMQYTEADLREAFNEGNTYGSTIALFHNTDTVSRGEYESLLDADSYINSIKKTEWDIEIIDSKFKLI